MDTNVRRTKKKKDKKKKKQRKNAFDLIQSATNHKCVYCRQSFPTTLGLSQHIGKKHATETIPIEIPKKKPDKVTKKKNY